MQLYRQERPFFLGLILGYFSGIAAANTSDFIWFNGQGHWLYGLLLREVDDLEGIR